MVPRSRVAAAVDRRRRPARPGTRPARRAARRRPSRRRVDHELTLGRRWRRWRADLRRSAITRAPATAAAVGVDDAARDGLRRTARSRQRSGRTGPAGVKERTDGGTRHGAPSRRVSRRREKDGPASRYPGSRIVASIPPSHPPCGASLRFGATVTAGLYRLEDGAPRLQWRHRVGFAPTSRGRRAESVQAAYSQAANVN